MQSQKRLEELKRQLEEAEKKYQKILAHIEILRKSVAEKERKLDQREIERIRKKLSNM
jgi:molecular chaperone GrpE (heat shock protein)